jgi:integrase/predicted RNA-binding Zn-ribbon protein involved in translation (DUF1610 family)
MVESAVILCCPECGSNRLYRDGIRYLSDGSQAQRWLCRSCGYRFSKLDDKLKITLQRDCFKPGSDLAESTVSKRNLSGKKLLDDGSFSFREDIVSHAVTNVGKGLNALRSYNGNSQVGAQKAKNLTQETELNTVPGDIQQSQQDLKGKLVQYSFYLEKQGYAPETIRTNNGSLRALQLRNADLLNPESVKETLAKEQKWSQNRRRNVINAYTLFLKVCGMPAWEKPKTNVVRKIPFIPNEAEIDALIAGAPTSVATFLQLLKETAMRSGEAIRLQWKDTDLEKRLITLNEPEKGSLPRQWNHLSQKLIDMLNAMPRNDVKVFGSYTLNSLKAMLCRTRRRMATKLRNPRLLGIHFHTLRHWKATMEYHKTKDLLHVMAFLGHKKSDNTLLYVQLDQSLFSDTLDEFTVKTAETPEEAAKLIEVGFQLADTIDGIHLYRKRK